MRTQHLSAPKPFLSSAAEEENTILGYKGSVFSPTVKVPPNLQTTRLQCDLQSPRGFALTF